MRKEAVIIMTKEAKERKQAYVIRYQRETYCNISFKVRTKEDSDIIDHLKSVPNKSEYIKSLIRSDIKAGK